MKTLYYLLGLLFLFNEIRWIIQPVKNAYNVIKAYQIQARYESDKNQVALINDHPYSLSQIIEILLGGIWLFFGLFTFNGWFFLFYLITQIFIGKITKKYRTGDTFDFKKYVAIHWINSVYSFLFGCFVIVNTYIIQFSAHQWIVDMLFN